MLAWIVFAYGRLVYNLLGPAATASFSNSWGIGVGLGQINDAKNLAITAAEGVLIVTVLEALWLVKNGNWLETYLDSVSVQATVLVDGGTRLLPAMLAAYKRHFNAVA